MSKNLGFYLVLTIFLLLNTILFSIDLTQNEINYIERKSEFVILVSTDNYPYEYLGKSGNPEGINIEIIRSFLSFTGKRIRFITNLNHNEKPDIISSFAEIGKNYNLSSNSIYTIYINSLGFSKTVNLDDINNFLIYKQDFLTDTINAKLPNKNFYLYEDLSSAFNQLEKLNNSMLFYDNIFNELVNNVMKKHLKQSNQRHYRDKDINQILNIADDNDNTFSINSIFKIPFYFYFDSDNRLLLNIVNKSFFEHEVNNKLYSIFLNFKNEIERETFVLKNQPYMMYLFFLSLLMFLILIFLLFRFKVLQFNLSMQISKIKEDNIKLNNEIENLNYHLENVDLQRKHVLDTISSLAFVLDLRGNFLYINKYCKETLGYEPINLIGKNIEKMISEEHKNRLLSLSTLSKTSDDSYNEIEIITKEGLNKDFIFSTNFTKSSKGDTEVNCILQDITDRKSLENRLEAYTNHLEDLVKQRTKTLKESEERFKFVIEKAYDGIFMIQNYQFTLVNEAFSLMTGFSKDKFYQTKLKLTDIIKPDLRDDFVNEINDNLEKNIGYFILNTQLLKYNGDICDVEIHFTTITSESETIILGVIHDIAEKKVNESKKLQNERLSVITSFAITANDRINSPLNAIQGYVELLECQTNEPKPVQIKAYDNIYKSISIIKNILNRLRSLTSVTLEKYNLDDLQMIDISKQFDDENEDKGADHE